MKPYAHQTEALIQGRARNLCLFHDCGTGKTYTALQIIKHWLMKGDGPALVVCPLSIIEAAWIADCKKFEPDMSIVSLWDKKPANRKKKLDQDHDIYVANYETLKNMYTILQRKGFGTLIVDESSRLKSPKSQITKALLSFAGIKFRGSEYKTDTIIPHRYVLSGTPAPNHEGEYWAQVKFVTGKGGACFNDNFYAFRSRYFSAIQLGMTGQRMYKFRDTMQQDLMDAMKPVTHIVRKGDVLDLPEQTHQIRKVFLSPAERAAYDTMKNHLVLQFEDETVLSVNALAEVMKLRQLASGFIYGDEGTHKTGKSKLSELSALLDEIGDNQAIIWINFQEEGRALLEKYPDAAVLWGGVKDRNAEIERFKSGASQYLIANPQSAAHGFTFTNCRYAIYFSLNYSYEFQKQSEDRIHRIGQRHAATYYYLVADRTIDEMIYKTVRRKGDLSRSILAYLKDGRYHIPDRTKKV